MTRQVEVLDKRTYIDIEVLSECIARYRSNLDWNGVKTVEGLVNEINNLPMFSLSTEIKVLK
jgi:hypothetical protein